MNKPSFVRIPLILLTAVLIAALPVTALAAEQTAKRFPIGIFNLYLSDELQGPLFGPVKKATIKTGQSRWTATFTRDGKLVSREQFIPGLTNETIFYEDGRPVKRTEAIGTDGQTVMFVRYDPAFVSFKLMTPGQDSAMVEVGSGTLNPQGLVTAKTFRISDNVLYEAMYEYDSGGLVGREIARITDRGTDTVERAYDKSGRILSRLSTSSSRIAGQPATEKLNKLEYRYNLKGQLTDAFFQADSPPSAVTLTIQGEYDNRGNWTSLVMTRHATAGQATAQTFTQEIEYY